MIKTATSTLLFLAAMLGVDAFTIPSNIHTPTPHSQHDLQNRHNSLYKLHTTTSTPPSNSQSTKKSSSTELYGIPKMFRWLTDQYPNINSRLSEGLSSEKVVDNFYLDMNGIIHPCTHGNNQDEIVVLDETAMFKKIFGYVDR